MKRLIPIILLGLFLGLINNEDAFANIPPMAYRLKPIVIRESRFYFFFDYPHTIFFAQIHQESLWNPEAKSWAGAEGLAQFMPSTADWIAKLYPKDLGNHNSYDVKWAIRGMVIYDKWLYDRIDSLEREPMMLSSYNGGLGNLNKDRKLTEDNGGNSGLWWGNVELYSRRSPSAFNENRHYVKAIIKRWIPLYEKEGF